MTHRGPFQPLPCWDSVIHPGLDVTTRRADTSSGSVLVNTL